MINKLTSTSLAAKDSIKEPWKTLPMDQLQSIAKFWKRQSTFLQPIEDFFNQPIQHSVATYEQTKKRLSNFYPKRIVKEHGVHTKPLHLYVLIKNFKCLCIFIRSN